jgi:hypothetical protein
MRVEVVMFELKPLSKSAVPAALAKAERYRLLNEPAQAASICEDILAVDPDQHEARRTLLLALTDQFAGPDAGPILLEAKRLVERLPGEYDRAYYSGLICERRAGALLASSTPGSGFLAYDWIKDAMEWFERAEALRPPDNDDAILRWNTCARLLMRNPHLQPQTVEADMPLSLE